MVCHSGWQMTFLGWCCEEGYYSYEGWMSGLNCELYQDYKKAKVFVTCFTYWLSISGGGGGTTCKLSHQMSVRGETVSIDNRNCVVPGISMSSSKQAIPLFFFSPPPPPQGFQRHHTPQNMIVILFSEDLLLASNLELQKSLLKIVSDSVSEKKKSMKALTLVVWGFCLCCFHPLRVRGPMAEYPRDPFSSGGWCRYSVLCWAASTVVFICLT